jgi:hypothetical protein
MRMDANSPAFWQTQVDYLHDDPRCKGLVWDVTNFVNKPLIF